MAHSATAFVSGTALRRIVRVVWEFPRDSTRLLVNIIIS